MKRLSYQIYLTILISLILVLSAAAALWRPIGGESTAEQAFVLAGRLVGSALPLADADPSLQRQAIEQISARLGLDMSLFDADMRVIGAAGRQLPPPKEVHDFGGRFQGPDGPALAIRLPDARWIVVQGPSSLRSRAQWRFALLGCFVGVIAVLCYPIVRRLTRNLERLQVAVKSLGAGNFTTRVNVEGHDEVAQLGESFNQAAAKIEQLVDAHKLLLANVSHELRTPLSRLRLSVELLKGSADPKRKADFENDIAEVDALIEQILLLSRLDALKELDIHEDIDLLALAAEEGARYEDCSVCGEPCFVRGDPTLLRRMIRNLLENARQHGSPPIKLEVRPSASNVILAMHDHGPGVPAADQERVFSPFYRVPGTQACGAGLGLALVREIARQHGGEVMWVPDEHHSSAIQVTMPAERRPCQKSKNTGHAQTVGA
ncbi:MAG: sensor histidine kinase [Methyloceanibacter sp.]|uniref:sensor histidine kinase n=1 Tax=Methyloceanibacter sp. TaxID=1965321 RepID=UPI003D6DA5BA